MDILRRQMIQALPLVLAGMLLMMSVPEALADDADNPCNKTLTDATGKISVPAGSALGLCNITVQRTAGAFTTLQFTSVILQGGDTLTVFDGNGTKPDTNITTLTESAQAAFTVVSHSSATAIIINVTVANTKSSMEATYDTSGCTISQSVSSGAYVQNPLYKAGTGAFSCVYSYSQKESASNTELALSFSEIFLPTASLTFTSPAKVPEVTGITVPADVYAPDLLNMTLAVTNSSKTTMETFKAYIAPVTTLDGCGKVVNVSDSTDLTVTVQSIHPLSYDCRITLHAVSGMSLMLNVTTLQLTSGGDRLTIVDGASSAGGSVLASLTTVDSGYLVLSSQKDVVVRLVVDESYASRSLAIKVTELATINHMYNAGTFMISPKTADGAEFPQTQYYVLEAAAGKMVKFLLGANIANKTKNYVVEVHDGCQTSDQLIVSFSSDNTHIPVTSTGNQMLVVAKWSNTSKGLNSSFSTTDAQECDHIMSASSGSFKLSSTAASPAPNSCNWTIIDNSGTKVLNFPLVKLSGKASVTVLSDVNGIQLAVLTADNTKPNKVVPSIVMAASSAWPRVMFSSGSDKNLTTVQMEAMYRVGGSLCGGAISDAHGFLQSPFYPNMYPLNSVCKWSFPGNAAAASRLLFFNFSNFKLAQNHSLTFVEHNTTSDRVMGTYGGMNPVPSLLFSSKLPDEVTFSSTPTKNYPTSTDVNQGFKVEYWVLNCGGNMTGSSTKLANPGYPKPVSKANKTLCVWTITVPPTNKSFADSVNIVKMKFAITTTGSVIANQTVKIFDGNSLGAPPLAYDTKGNATYSRFNSVIILFDSSTLPQPGSVAFQVNYTTYMCNKSNLCDNGICIHPGWRCNGLDDCGDNSDERNCVFQPTTPKPSTGSKSGVKPYVVALLFFIGLFIGVIATVCVPRIIRRVRSNRYTSFHNEPALA